MYMSRNVLVTMTDGGSILLPIDAYKAALVIVDELEDKYARLMPPMPLRIRRHYQATHRRELIFYFYYKLPYYL